MPPRAAKRGASAKKQSPRTKKATTEPKPDEVPLSVIEENKISESEVLSSPVEDKKVPEAATPSTAAEDEEVKQGEEVSMTKALEAEEVFPSTDEEKIVIKEEVSVTTVVVEETKTTVVVEETKVEEIAEDKRMDLATSNAGSDVEMEGSGSAKDSEEVNGEENENEGNQMDLEQAAKQDLFEEETPAADIEDRVGGGDGDDTTGANESGNREAEGDKSGSDDEEDEDPSAYMQAPLTDRKKQKEFEIFVGGLDREAVEEDLIKVFGDFGEIQAVRIVKHPITQKSKGFAFIRYATVEQAKKVLDELKDGTEVRGKRVGISPSQDSDTLYMGNICKTWKKENVLETLKTVGIEQIEEIYLPDDPKNEGRSRGFALLEFSTHSDAMAAFQRLRKPDAVFGCDRSAKVAFAQSSIHPSEEALSQVKTVFIEGMTDSWDEEKLKELCKQYGEIEKVQLSRNLVTTKRKDFGFVSFTSRESATSCVEGINNAQIEEGDVKVKANLAKPQYKGRLGKHAARGGYKLNKDGTEEVGPSKMKGHAKYKGAEGKGKALPKLKTAKGGKPFKPQGSFGERRGAGAPSRPDRTDRQRMEQPAKGGKRGGRSMDIGSHGRPSKKPRGNMRGRPTTGFGYQRTNSHFAKGRQNYGMAPPTYVDPYAQGYAAPASSYQGHAYSTLSGSKRNYSDMEPHAGYLGPATGKQGQDPYGYGLRRAGGYDGQGSSGTAYGGGSVPPPSYVPGYPSYAAYEGGSSGGGYGYPSSGAYPPRQAHY